MVRRAQCPSLLGHVWLAGESLQAEKLLSSSLHLGVPQLPHVEILSCFP